MRRLKLELVCDQAELVEAGRRLASGISLARVAEWLLACGHIVTTRDVLRWRDSENRKPDGPGEIYARPVTSEDLYLDAIARMHDFCESHELQFKGAMVLAIEQFVTAGHTQMNDGRAVGAQTRKHKTR